LQALAGLLSIFIHNYWQKLRNKQTKKQHALILFLLYMKPYFNDGTDAGKQMAQPINPPDTVIEVDSITPYEDDD